MKSTPTSVRIPPKLRAAALQRAADLEVTLSQLVSLSLRTYLEDYGVATRRDWTRLDGGPSFEAASGMDPKGSRCPHNGCRLLAPHHMPGCPYKVPARQERAPRNRLLTGDELVAEAGVLLQVEAKAPKRKGGR
jgi:hypothetical protein